MAALARIVGAGAPADIALSLPRASPGQDQAAPTERRQVWHARRLPGLWSHRLTDRPGLMPRLACGATGSCDGVEIESPLSDLDDQGASPPPPADSTSPAGRSSAKPLGRTSPSHLSKARPGLACPRCGRTQFRTKRGGKWEAGPVGHRRHGGDGGSDYAGAGRQRCNCETARSRPAADASRDHVGVAPAMRAHAT